METCEVVVGLRPGSASADTARRDGLEVGEVYEVRPVAPSSSKIRKISCFNHQIRAREPWLGLVSGRGFKTLFVLREVINSSDMVLLLIADAAQVPCCECAYEAAVFLVIRSR